MILTWILCSLAAGSIALVATLAVYAIIHHDKRCRLCARCRYLKTDRGGWWRVKRYSCRVNLWSEYEWHASVKYCSDYATREEDNNG